ncbi:MAG: GNAT family N-acetyltransferase [Pleurocapsa minor GSE-CHR-MK-17-07R]|jgi:ribosomal protein S18 acetylase RimI-like enzyme|nr:GNAT family N-acetyltransferase [Pleurocapsa minor GSE-CHR-MK 17-07R]
MGISLIESRYFATLLHLLHDADEDDRRIAQALQNRDNTSYLAYADGRVIGALVLCRAPEHAEIVYLAVPTELRGHGYGRDILSHLANAMRSLGVGFLLVGTANASIGNIVFYQKCGFRMDSVRKGFFDDLAQPAYENGIRIRDLLMLRLDL